MRVKDTLYEMRAIRGSCPTQSRHLALIYEQQSLHAVFFFSYYVLAVRDYQQLIAAVQVSTPLRNDDSASSIVASNLQRIYEISKRHSLDGYDRVRM